MSFEEGVQFKKYVVKIPSARQDLKMVYKLREILNNNKLNLEKKCNKNLGKPVLNKLYKKNDYFMFVSKFETAMIFIMSIFSMIVATGVFLFIKNQHFVISFTNFF